MKELVVIDDREVLGVSFQIYGTFEEPLFLAKDVATWIEHNKPSELLSNIDPNDKLKAIVSLAGQNREVWFLTEDGLYEVLMLSRKPKAKEFKKEIKKILKALRKQEIKIVPIQPTLPQSYAEALRELATTVEENEKLKLIQEQNKPKIEFFDTVTDSTDAIDMGGVAKVLNKGIGRNNLFALLRNYKVLKGDNQPYQKYIDMGYFRVIESKFNKPNGDIGINLKTVVYQTGVAYISDLIEQYKEEHYQ